MGVPLYLFVIAFLGVANLAAEQRNMVILLDDSEAYTNIYRAEDPLDVGGWPTTCDLLNAVLGVMEGKGSYYILATASLWRTVLEHARIFDDFTNLDDVALRKKYGNYPRFSTKGKIAIFKAACRDIANSLLQKTAGVVNFFVAYRLVMRLGKTW